jgi:glucan biosynthesis protein C
VNGQTVISEASLTEASTQTASVAGYTIRDPSIDYLRATITLLVLLVHSAVPFTRYGRLFAHLWNGPIPIIYGGAWIGFDYLFHFADNCLMALMFFISTVFAYSSLKSHGAAIFLKKRLLRLGLPFFVSWRC